MGEHLKARLAKSEAEEHQLQKSFVTLWWRARSSRFLHDANKLAAFHCSPTLLPTVVWSQHNKSDVSASPCRVQVAARKGEGALKVPRQEKSEAEEQQLQKSFATLWWR